MSKKVIVACLLPDCDRDLTVEVSGAFFRGSNLDQPESLDLGVTSTCRHEDAYFQETAESKMLYDELYEEVMEELAAQEIDARDADRWRDRE